MKIKGIVIALFALVTIGFIFGFVSYNNKLQEALSKEITLTNINGNNNNGNEDPTPLTPVESAVETGVETIVEEPETAIFSLEVTVPHLYGMTRDEAEAKLKEVGLVGDANPEYKDDVDKDIVFWQTPYKNIVVERGTTVHYSVSKGPEEGSAEEPSTTGKVEVPNLIGLSESAAVAKLASLELGADVDFERAYNNNTEEGYVFSQNYKIGAMVDKGTTIGLRISLGKKPENP